MTQRAINGDYIYFVTTNTTFGRWYFIVPEEAVSLGKIIRGTCTEFGFILFGYCILPNHIHLLVKKNEITNLSRLMKHIKGRFWRHVCGDRFWQPRYNFRIVEDERRFGNTIQYIQYNYRKMELENIYGRYPFVYIDWEKISNILKD